MFSIQKRPRATILVVDDEDEIVQFMQDALEDEGYTVCIAFDGAQAVNVARQSNPDLVILDIMLPKRDGFAVCKELCQELDIPILFLSAKQSDADKIQGFSAGADDYVMKPFSIKELVARVEAHLRRQSCGQSQYIQQACNVLCLNYEDLSISEIDFAYIYHNLAAQAGRVSIDHHRIEQVLDNLFENALRYTPTHGKISLICTYQQHSLSFVLCDTGCGIPSEDLPHVFEKFYRGKLQPGDKARKSGGLGLHICKLFVEKHGGTIAIQNRPTGGCEVTICVPTTLVTSAQRPY